MCGLAGVWATGGDRAIALREQVGRMADTLVHRGPDDSGCWIDPEAGLAFGFRRLAIIDLTDSGHQPMISSEGRYVIVFNGEIYNFRELRTELEGLGFVFRGSSDTEVILGAASAWGFDRAVSRLWGMFAIALWDRQERVLSLARDRLGKKPLYYGQCGRTWLFGSELKTLRAHPDFVPALDHAAVVNYVRLGYVPAPQSIYRGVAKVPPGSLVHLRAGAAPVVQAYWRATQFFDVDRDSSLEDRPAIDEMERLLRDAVARRMIADVPLGAMLSGGVDSSTVVALMQAQASRPVKTFTIGFHHAEYDEARAAAAVANHLGTEHHTLFVTPEETRETIPRLPDLYDEPFADSSQIPTFVLSRLTRRHVTVGLSGDGGDELLGGYTRYGWASTAWRWIGWSPAAVRRALARVATRIDTRTWDGIYRAVERIVPSRSRVRFAGDKLHKFAEIAGARDWMDFCEGVASIWKRPHEIIRPEYSPTVPWPIVDTSGMARNRDLRVVMMQLDLLTYLPDDILVKVDRASMGASLEVRAPLLDHRIVEWVSRLPLRFKIRHGTSKWLLRQVLYRYVPPTLIERPKMGFGVPIGLWLRGALRDWAESLLSERELAASGVFDAKRIRAFWTAHLSGTRNHEQRLWVVLMYQAWRHRWAV